MTDQTGAPQAGALPLEHLQIMCCGFKDSEREEAKVQVSSLGGRLKTALELHDPPHVIVATTVRFKHYESLVLEQKVPVVTSQWLAACWNSRKRVPYEDHKLGPFAGLLVCCTGITVTEKELLANKIRSGGGVHCPDLTKKCTHLVAKERQGPKYKFADNYNIPVVSAKWVDACLQLGVCRPAAGFPAPGPHVAPKAIAARARMAAAPVSHPLPVAQPLPESAPGQHYEDDNACFGFLEGVQVYLCGCDTAERLQFIRICRAGGGIYHSQLLPWISHILVGSCPSSSELDAVRVHQEQRRAEVRVVGADWLRACSTSRKLLLDHHFLLPASTLIPHPQDDINKDSVQDLLVDKSSVANGDMTVITDVTNSGVPGILDGEATTDNRLGALSNCWFTLAALEGQKELRDVHQKVREAGGRTFDAKTLDLVKSARNVYALCPDSLPPDAALSLAKKKPDFKHVHETMRVTIPWLETSIAAGSPRPHQSKDRVYYKPLSYPLPLPGMERVRACASLYDEDAKDNYRHIVKLLGGSFTFNMSSKNTHVILPKAAGDKYANAAHLGVIPVTGAWLIESARAGHLQPESNYPPPDPLPQEKAQLEETVRQLRARAGSQATRPLEVENTQMPSTNLNAHFAGLHRQQESSVAGSSGQQPGRMQDQPVQSRPTDSHLTGPHRPASGLQAAQAMQQPCSPGQSLAGSPGTLATAGFDAAVSERPVCTNSCPVGPGLRSIRKSADAAAELKRAIHQPRAFAGIFDGVHTSADSCQAAIIARMPAAGFQGRMVSGEHCSTAAEDAASNPVPTATKAEMHGVPSSAHDPSSNKESSAARGRNVKSSNAVEPPSAAQSSHLRAAGSITAPLNGSSMGAAAAGITVEQQLNAALGAAEATGEEAGLQEACELVMEMLQAAPADPESQEEEIAPVHDPKSAHVSATLVLSAGSMLLAPATSANPSAASSSGLSSRSVRATRPSGRRAGAVEQDVSQGNSKRPASAAMLPPGGGGKRKPGRKPTRAPPEAFLMSQLEPSQQVGYDIASKPSTRNSNRHRSRSAKGSIEAMQGAGVGPSRLGAKSAEAHKEQLAKAVAAGRHAGGSKTNDLQRLGLLG